MSISLILLVVGSIALVTLKGGRALLGALLVQWVGVALVAGEAQGVQAGSGGASAVVVVEMVTAAASVAVMAFTLYALKRIRPEQLPGLEPAQLATLRRSEEQEQQVGRGQRPAKLTDQLWLWAIVLAGGVAGVGLARLYPLGGDEQTELALYWLVLAGVLALVVDGARNPVKLAGGLLALINGLILLTVNLSAVEPGPMFLALLAAGRLAFAAIMSYGWLMLRLAFVRFDLDALFDAREGIFPTDTSLVPITEDADRHTPSAHEGLRTERQVEGLEKMPTTTTEVPATDD